MFYRCCRRVSTEAGFHGEIFYLVIEFAVGVVEFAYFAEEGYLLVDVVFDGVVVHLELSDDFFFGVYLRVFAEG